MKTKISLIIAVVIVLSLSGMAGANLVNSNSKLEDGIKYYIQTDKFVYNLGENVEMLYRITNLRDEDVTFGTPHTPPWNFWVQKDANDIWRAVNGWYAMPTIFTLGPGESKDFPHSTSPYVWNMRDKDNNLVNAGQYSVIGGLYAGSEGYEYSKVAVPIQIIPEPAVDAGIDIEPDTLNLKGKGKWITCYIWLPEDYNAAEIVPDSIFLERMIKPVWTWVDEEQQLAMAKFSRSEVQGILEVGELELTITGQLIDGMTFEGTDTIRVILKGRLRRRRVNSNSIVEDGIEYYIQTDKAVYNLGEDVDFLYRVTNLRDEEWRIEWGFPIFDVIAEEKDGENFNEIWHWSWDKIHHFGGIVVILGPQESTELNEIWPQIDLNGSVEPEDHTQVPPGRYRISGVFSPTDSSIAVDITIVKRKS